MIDQNDITHRLRCKYANGPMVDGEPEFGWRDMSCTIMTAFPTPIDLEAANLIEQLRASLAASMQWVPIEWANLMMGEVVDIWWAGRRVPNCVYKIDTFIKAASPVHDFRLNEVTHILRIKPAASKGEGA